MYYQPFHLDTAEVKKGNTGKIVFWENHLHAKFFLVSFRFPPFFIRIRIRVGVEGSSKFSARGPQGKMIQSCIRIRNTAYSNLSYISLNIMSKILNSLYSACKEISSRKILQDFFIYTSYYWKLKVSNCIKN